MRIVCTVLQGESGVRTAHGTHTYTPHMYVNTAVAPSMFRHGSRSHEKIIKKQQNE